MTERFSPEYIAFILSDEAKVLQGQWKEPVIGDWALVFPKSTLGGVTGLVVRMGVGQWRHTTLRFGDGCEGDFNHRVQLCWLPTLTDSLDMIEEAGYWWSTGLDYDGDDKWYTISAGSIEDEGYIENDHKDRMLAAAKLAVRVLEEKHD